MSNDAMNCAWKADDAPTDPGPMWILIILADHANDHSGEDFAAFPSVERLQSRSKYSRAAVERNLQALVDLGWISRRRRVRPDGKKGVYDYEMHRDPERRGALRAARAAILAAGEKPSGDISDLDHPCCNLQHGPCVNLEPAMLQIGDEPCCNLQHQEPLEEPLDKPSTGAREPGDAGFEAALAAWPDSGRKRTRLPAARASWARVCSIETPARLMAAIAACAADPDLAKGDYGWPAFDAWLADERWRFFLPVAGPTESARPRAVFAGSPELRAAIVADPRFGEAWAGSYLDRCAWDPGGRTLTPAGPTAAGKLAAASAIFRHHDIAIAAPSGGTS
jgi:hypothetical protein